jgi:hypothetical protein
MVLQIPSQTKVTANGQAILLATDATTITGCPFVIGVVPHPCVTVQWSGLATKVTIQEQAPLLDSSTGLCQGPDGAPQGTVLLSGVQTKVMAE